jgi:GNAT superfamily N-acetyltransferase
VPRADIVIESPILPSFRVEQIRGMFDVSNRSSVRHEWSVDIPIEDREWRIGLIIGPSGSGKTTIGRRLFPDAHFHEGYDWPSDAAIVDGFPSRLDGKEITQALSSVGFSSPPHWLKRHSHLSNGQKFRCELARLILEDAETVIFDEFTSVVDRDAAKISSAAVAKAVRARNRPRLIALSCHYDVINWLQPDWTYDTAAERFDWRCLQRHPEIRLEIHKADRRAWSLFRGHHYLSRDINEAAQCYVATWNGSPVAFTSYLHFPHATARNIKRGHRTVVLPDFQGVGIGNRLSEWLGSHLRAGGWRFRSVTSHPAMIRHRSKSPLWRLESIGRMSQHSARHRSMAGVGGFSSGQASAMRRSSSANRMTASFEFVGPSTLSS